MNPYYEKDGITILHGDCRDILPTLTKVDLVLTDPPYGIGYEASRYQHASFSGVIAGDEADFSPEFLLPIGKEKILWGANNYAMRLPRGGWLCWDKRVTKEADKILGSPFELAWHSNPAKYEIARILHGGAVNADGRFPRQHPTQKPLALMAWCLMECSATTGPVLDPFMGSGTTLVAARNLGRRAIGIEIEEKYCEIAAKRLQQQLLPMEA